MAKKFKEEEAKKLEGEEKKAHEDEAKKHEGEEKKKEGDDDGHDDAEKDKKLIAEMISKYLGDDHKEDEAAHEAGKKAFEAYKEMGYSEDEAMKCAGHSMKLAKHMKSKEEEGDDKDGDKEEEKKKEDGADDQDADDKHDDKKEPPKKDEKKDDKKEEGEEKKMERELIRVRGELASLKERERKSNLEKYMDEKLAESKIARRVTKENKELLCKVRSKEEFDEKLKLFMEGFKASGTDGGEAYGLFEIQPEKIAESSGKTGFGDCVTEE